MKENIIKKITEHMTRVNLTTCTAEELYDELIHATGKMFGDMCDGFGLTPEEERFVVEQSI